MNRSNIKSILPYQGTHTHIPTLIFWCTIISRYDMMFKIILESTGWFTGHFRGRQPQVNGEIGGSWWLTPYNFCRCLFLVHFPQSISGYKGFSTTSLGGRIICKANWSALQVFPKKFMLVSRYLARTKHEVTRILPLINTHRIHVCHIW